MAFTKITTLPDGNILQRGAGSGVWYYAAYSPTNLSVTGVVNGYTFEGGIKGRSYSRVTNESTSTPPLIITTPSGDKLSYSFATGALSLISNVHGTDVSGGTTVVNGVTTYTLDGLLGILNFGSNDTKIKSFLSNSSNDSLITQATEKLNYQIPTTNTNPANTISQIRQLYWGAYYCSKYPIPSNPTALIDCDSILQTIQSLRDDYASIQQQISTSDANNFYGVDSAVDYNMELQAITDLGIVYNGLASKLSCTKSAAAGTPSKIATYLVVGIGILIIVVVVKKITK